MQQPRSRFVRRYFRQLGSGLYVELDGRPRVETLSVPPIMGPVELQPDSINEEARTVDLVFYSGAIVLRFPFFDDPFELEFEVSKKAIRMSRLESGAPLLDSHQKFGGIKSILGVVERAWIADGQARATVRFSRRDEVEPVWQDVQDQVIRNVSMGAQIHELVEVTAKDADIQRFRATDWEPMELSLLGVGADPGAQVLEAEAGQNPCRVEFIAATQPQGEAMKIKVRLLVDCEGLGKTGDVVEIEETAFDASLHSKDLEAPTPTPSSGDRSVAEMRREIDAKLEEEKAYAAEVKRLAAFYGCDDLWVQRQINLHVDLTDVIASATAVRAERAPQGPSGVGVGTDWDSAEAKIVRMSDAIVARATQKEPDEAARAFFGMSFAQLALECLGLRGRGRGLDAKRDFARIISSELALHTTSDFPLLLANALNKILLPEYELATPTYRQLATQRQFTDFRAHNFLRGGDFPALLQVNEHGEFRYGTMGENQEPVTAATYGRIIGLSRQTLINDDLGAFADIAGKAGRRVADFENATFFTVCILAGAGLGPNLSDAVAVYNAAHGNVNAGGVLSNDRLGEALSLMMIQTGLDGLKLNVIPRIVLTSPTSVVLARTLLAAIQPTQASEVNPFAGDMIALGDANLTGVRYYVLADPAQLPNYIYGFIGGAGPRTETRSGFEVDGVEFKIALDFGVGAIDFRGGVTGAGV